MRIQTTRLVTALGVVVATVEEGKRADLLVVKENPLKKIGRLADPAGVLVNGVWLSEEVLDARLEALAARWLE